MSVVTDDIHVSRCGGENPVIGDAARRVSREGTHETIRHRGGDASARIIDHALRGPITGSQSGPCSQDTHHIVGVSACEILRSKIECGSRIAGDGIHAQDGIPTGAGDRISTRPERDARNDLYVLGGEAGRAIARELEGTPEPTSTEGESGSIRQFAKVVVGVIEAEGSCLHRVLSSGLSVSSRHIRPGGQHQRSISQLNNR